MIKIKVTPEVRAHCENQVKEHSFAWRSHSNGSKEQQKNGIIGQSMVQLELGGNMVDGSKGPDKGIDIIFEGVSIDIKTNGTGSDTQRHYRSSIYEAQMKFPVDIYIFCGLNTLTNDLTIAGWIDKESFKQKAKCYKNGEIDEEMDFKYWADKRVIKNYELNNVNSIEELKAGLLQWKQSKNLVNRIHSPLELTNSL